MKTSLAFFCFVALTLCVLAADPTAPAAKPALKPAADGFPAGSSTPEGAACDLARAFIKADTALFAATCIPAFGGGDSRAQYQRFLDGVTGSMKTEAAKDKPSPGGPRAIEKVFAARHLGKEGPASYGYAAFNFDDVMFVDLVAALQNKQTFKNRTLVIKKKDRWYVLPMPDAYSLLSTGLNEEPDSTVDFSEAYTVEK